MYQVLDRTDFSICGSETSATRPPFSYCFPFDASLPLRAPEIPRSTIPVKTDIGFWGIGEVLRTAGSVDPTKNPRTEDEYHCKTRFSVICGFLERATCKPPSKGLTIDWYNLSIPMIFTEMGSALLLPPTPHRDRAGFR